MKSIDEILMSVNIVKKSINMASGEQKDGALFEMADSLEQGKEKVLDANQKDVRESQGRISSVMLDRLYLDEHRIDEMIQGMREVAQIPDPIGRVLEVISVGNGLKITKVSTALGVIASIYESRPNVTSDIAALAIKSGNACVLKSGKAAYRTAHAIVSLLKSGISKTGISPNVLELVTDTSRESSYALMRAKEQVDLLIPRGGLGLIQTVSKNAIVPVIETGTGICHIYVDKSANQDMALSIIENSKISRPSVCNAMEVCLVHSAIAETFLPKLHRVLVEKQETAGLYPVELRLDDGSRKIIPGNVAKSIDFDTEFLDYIMAVKLVGSLEEATMHIDKHSTHHSDAIITEDEDCASYFTQQVDSSVVYVNASTRFTDSGQFGYGCEVGISTQKLHARGPMGVRELTTYKYIVMGTGQVRD